jgi:hypothetical protein
LDPHLNVVAFELTHPVWGERNPMLGSFDFSGDADCAHGNIMTNGGMQIRVPEVVIYDEESGAISR